MSQKLFCDCCHKEITKERETERLTTTYKGLFRLEPKVIPSGLSTLDICKYCFIDAVNFFDDRPRAP